MSLTRIQKIVSLAVALSFLMTASWPTKAQSGSTLYPTMAPVERYLMSDRDAEIAMARSAAPESISHDATILVLGRQGYETAVQGNNGFVCAVERGWMGPFDGDGSGNFWNPKVRGPICFNPPAVRSILPLTYKRTAMILAGKSKAEIIDALKSAYAKKEFPPVEPGSMSYMLSKQQYLTDRGDHRFTAHLMIYTPLMDGAAWGADLPLSPVMLSSQFRGAPEPINNFMIPTGKWSDGTVAPLI
jgi:hypothetical protein